MQTQLPVPPRTTGRHAAPAAPRRGGRALLVGAVLALVVGGTATGAALLDPDPAPAPTPAAVTAPPAPTPDGDPPPPVPRPDYEDQVSIAALPLAGGCPRKGCAVRHLLTNHGVTDAPGTFRLIVDGQVVSVVPLTLPAGGTTALETWIPGTVLAAHPDRKLKIEAEFGYDRGMTV